MNSKANYCGPQETGQSVELEERPQTLLLDFQLKAQGECILITRSPFPLIRPSCVVAVFNASAFDVPGGLDVKVNLLHTFEREFGDWEEHSGRPASTEANSSASDALEASWILSVTKLRSIAQLHRAIDLFVKTASKLGRLPRPQFRGANQS